MAATKTAAPRIEPLFMSIDDAEALTGISRWTWRSKAYAGVVESCKVGRRLMIPVKEVSRIMNEGTRPRRDGRPAGAPSKPEIGKRA